MAAPAMKTILVDAAAQSCHGSHAPPLPGRPAADGKHARLRAESGAVLSYWLNVTAWH